MMKERTCLIVGKAGLEAILLGVSSPASLMENILGGKNKMTRNTGYLKDTVYPTGKIYIGNKPDRLCLHMFSFIVFIQFGLGTIDPERDAMAVTVGCLVWPSHSRSMEHTIHTVEASLIYLSYNMSPGRTASG